MPLNSFLPSHLSWTLVSSVERSLVATALRFFNLKYSMTLFSTSRILERQTFAILTLHSSTFFNFNCLKVVLQLQSAQKFRASRIRVHTVPRRVTFEKFFARLYALAPPSWNTSIRFVYPCTRTRLQHRRWVRKMLLRMLRQRFLSLARLPPCAYRTRAEANFPTLD